MKVIITESGELRELTIIDRRSGQHYEAELVGRDNGLAKFDNERQAQPMAADQYAWWEAVLDSLQTAEDRKENVLAALDDEQAAELEADLAAIDCDLEDVAAAMNREMNRAEFADAIDKVGWPLARVATRLGLSKSSIEKRLSGAVAVRAGELAALASFAEAVPARWVEITIKDQCMSQAVRIDEDEVTVLHDDIGNVEEVVYGLGCDDNDAMIRQLILKRINDNPADYMIAIVRG